MVDDHYEVKVDGAWLRAGDLPDFLLPVRDRSARFAGLLPAALEHALLLDYPPGAAIEGPNPYPASALELGRGSSVVGVMRTCIA